MKILLAFLFILPLTFADSLIPNQPFTPMDFVWYVFAFCVFAILFILHHITIEARLNRPVKKA